MEKLDNGVISRMKSTRNLFPSRLYSLDVTRGIASLSIILYHWKHFFYTGAVLVDFNMGSLPFYKFLFLFYQNGNLAVDYFFVLSGFIFYWLYSNQIGQQRISLKNFSILRLSRLYPLHFVTLIFVLVLQTLYRSSGGYYFVNTYNDVYHFLLQLFFASHWGIQMGHSFNGPVWSVSIEVLLYGIFFLVCVSKLKRYWGALILAFVGIILDVFLHLRVARGLSAFFLGGCVYLLASHLILIGFKGKRVTLLCAACIFIWLVMLMRMKTVFPDRLLIVGLFCLTILCLVLVETERGHLGKRLSFLGDISYSTYMIHFPLQILIAYIFLLVDGNMALFLNPISLIMFYLLLVPLALICYRRFEHPVQKFIRRELLDSTTLQ
ncbi:MAG: acyltransferase [Anaerolineales bacterium]|nr:acyltransferase [Anaerolineales bacterium]